MVNTELYVGVDTCSYDGCTIE